MLHCFVCQKEDWKVMGGKWDKKVTFFKQRVRKRNLSQTLRGKMKQVFLLMSLTIGTWYLSNQQTCHLGLSLNEDWLVYWRHKLFWFSLAVGGKNLYDLHYRKDQSILLISTTFKMHVILHINYLHMVAYLKIARKLSVNLKLCWKSWIYNQHFQHSLKLDVQI